MVSNAASGGSSILQPMMRFWVVQPSLRKVGQPSGIYSLGRTVMFPKVSAGKVKPAHQSAGYL